MKQRNAIIIVLLLGVIILGSIVAADHTPAPKTVLPSMQSAMATSTGPGAMAPMGMMLKTFDVDPNSAVPTVAFHIQADPTSMGGYDLHILTTNFTWTPENVNQPPVANQGHAHLYIDNTLYVVYGPWYHIDDLSPGTHSIVVALAANDHSIFALNGNYIEATTSITQQ